MVTGSQKTTTTSEFAVIVPPLRIKRNDDRFSAARRREIMLAGWENDEKSREKLGSYETAVWFIGRLAADPSITHPYASFFKGERDDRSWREYADEFRLDMELARKSAGTIDFLAAAPADPPGEASQVEKALADEHRHRTAGGAPRMLALTTNEIALLRIVIMKQSGRSSKQDCPP